MNIPWEKLESARGHADPTAIPRHLNMLFSRSEKERKTGYRGIDNHAVVQSGLCTTAPYTAYLIADRLSHGEAPTPEAIDTLIELYLGTGSESLKVGPLAGESLEVLCKRFVRNAAVTLADRRNQLDGVSRKKLGELIQVLMRDS